MSLLREVTRRYVDLTYWPPDAKDGYNQIVPSEPVIIKGHWRQSTVLLDSEMQSNITSKAQIWSTSELKNEGYLFEGVSKETDPRQVEGAEKILDVLRGDSIRGVTVFYKAWV